MKKLIGYIGTYLFYFLGNTAGNMMIYIPAFWNLYQYFMEKSVKIQDWAGLEKPWEKIKS